MAVTNFKTFSMTLASNSPAGTDAVGTELDDHLRALKQGTAQAGRWDSTATVSSGATIADTMLHKIQPVKGDTAGAAVTITLPSVSATDMGEGWCTQIRNTTGTQLVIIDGNGAQTIDGALTRTLSATSQAVVLVSNGVAWFTVSESNHEIGRIRSLTAVTDVDTTREVPMYDTSASANVKMTLANLSNSVVVYSETNTTQVVHVTTTVPFDDTIPQRTEGQLILKHIYTPKSTNSTLRVDANVYGENTAAVTTVLSLFNSANASALASSWIQGTAGNSTRIGLQHTMTSTQVSASTMTLAIVVGTVTGGKFTVNGENNARKLGGAVMSTFSITEYVK